MLTKTLSILSLTTFLASHAFAGDKPSAPQPDPNTTQSLNQKDLDVIIYSSKNCSSCHRVKELFDEKKIKYTEKNVDNNPTLFAEMKSKTDKETVPQVIINGKHVGSYRHLMLGGLDDVLKEMNSSAQAQEKESKN